MKIRVGDLVTTVNHNTGKPYKKFYGLLAGIRDHASGKTFASMDQQDPNFLFYECEIEWIVAPQWNYLTAHNATYVCRHEND